MVKVFFNLLIRAQALTHQHDPLHLMPALEAAIETGNVNFFETLKPYLQGYLQNPLYFLKAWSSASAAGNTQFIELLKSYFQVHDPLCLSTILVIASAVDDIQLIEFPVTIGCDLNPRDLGLALVIAVRKGQHQLAKMLKDSNADTNMSRDQHKSKIFVAEFEVIDRRKGLEDIHRRKELEDIRNELNVKQDPKYNRNTPLIEALLRHDSSLFCTLIEADARPNESWDQSSSYGPAILLAVEWGDRLMIQGLIDNAVNVNATGIRNRRILSALVISVQKCDRNLTTFLLYAGANPIIPNIETTKHYQFEDYGDRFCTPLAAAA